ncbi:hypothetical protein BUALT_Bualt10G0135500 [Buddleja alternifolia]|uniref:DOG1 domain-containing protein n=1 Tax=Buddleja alternifolia TaxID=168488 RepID=A0AAV6WXR0_9LAMI|nr:hypothetical protein BUALT_Bualt10G0135500 [Buddleja alternifolia]
MATSDKNQEHCLYADWMNLQAEELSDLIRHSLNLNSNDAENTSNNDAEVKAVLKKIMQNFHDYSDRRRRLARRDVSAYFCPSWCTTLENSMFWLAGCRPSSYFSLIYALCGSEIDSKLSQFLQAEDGDTMGSGFPHLSASQLSAIDKLQRRTIADEEKLSTQLAMLQQDMADMPLALIARKAGPTYEFDSDVKDAIHRIEIDMFSIMEAAEDLRLNTVKEIIEILAPVQSLEYILAAKKLRLCFKSWAIERDREHGRNLTFE